MPPTNQGPPGYHDDKSAKLLMYHSNLKVHLSDLIPIRALNFALFFCVFFQQRMVGPPVRKGKDSKSVR